MPPEAGLGPSRSPEASLPPPHPESCRHSPAEAALLRAGLAPDLRQASEAWVCSWALTTVRSCGQEGREAARSPGPTPPRGSRGAAFLVSSRSEGVGVTLVTDGCECHASCSLPRHWGLGSCLQTPGPPPPPPPPPQPPSSLVAPNPGPRPRARVACWSVACPARGFCVAFVPLSTALSRAARLDAMAAFARVPASPVPPQGRPASSSGRPVPGTSAVSRPPRPCKAPGPGCHDLVSRTRPGGAQKRGRCVA